MFKSITKCIAFLGAIAAMMTATVVMGQGEVCLVFAKTDYGPLITETVTNCQKQLADSSEPAVSCTADYSQTPSYADLETQCGNITDGTFRPQNYTQQCGQVSVTAANLPYCISQSCNQEYLSDYRTEVEKAINDAYKEVGLDCKVKLEDSGAYTTKIFAAAAATIAMAFLAM